MELTLMSTLCAPGIIKIRGESGHCGIIFPIVRTPEAFNKMEELKNEKRGDRKRSRRVQKENG